MKRCLADQIIETLAWQMTQIPEVIAESLDITEEEVRQGYRQTINYINSLEMEDDD